MKYKINLLSIILPLVLLCGCSATNEPIVGTWKLHGEKTELVCNRDGTGVHRFDYKSYYELNHTYEGVETKIRWEKQRTNVYVIHYFYKKMVYDQQGKIENGKLVFDQGDYHNVFTK